MFINGRWPRRRRRTFRFPTFGLQLICERSNVASASKFTDYMQALRISNFRTRS